FLGNFQPFIMGILTPILTKVSEGALYHHERFDGTGYAYGLIGEKIPIEARIIGIADAVDAMNSTRPYRERQTRDYIIYELKNGRGTQFDPMLVDVMLEMINDNILNPDFEPQKE
ncbi:HD-GYP domain-containing protein, partial [Acetobacterium wieringae]|uniref:HD-GYP domain-containing protein n=1 Tax=Acetobacterium wieringae TaxID=52694 RepID=UPI0026E970B5